MESPPRIEPYELQHALSLFRKGAAYTVRNRETGAEATLWLSEAPMEWEAPSHPHLVEVYARGVRDGYEYRVTEPVTETVGTLLARQGALPSEQAISLVVGVARGLSALIAAGASITAVDADDVAIAPDGTPKLISFFLERSAPSRPTSLTASLGALYAQMLTGRSGDPADPLSRTAAEILRSLVSCELTREGVERGHPRATRSLPYVEPTPSASALAPRARPTSGSMRRPVAAGALGTALVLAGVALGLHVGTLLPSAMVPRTEPSSPRARLADRAPRIADPLPATADPSPRRPAGRDDSAVQQARRTPAATHVVGARERSRPARKGPETRTPDAGRPATSPRPEPRTTSRLTPVRDRGPRAASPLPGTGSQEPGTRSVSPVHPDARPLRSSPVAPPSPGPAPTRVARARVQPLVSPPAPIRREPPASPERAVDAGEFRSPPPVHQAPLVRLKVIVDEEGRVENAVVVDSSGDARRDQAAVSATFGKQIVPPLPDDRREGGIRVAYAIFDVASPARPRLVRSERRLP